jgi:hypothetical protein
MADQQPGDEPAAGEPDDSRVAGDPSTVDAPARWSGSATVPPPGPKKSRNLRRAARLARADETASPAAPKAAQPGAAQARPEPPARSEPDPTTVDPRDWASMPAVDPWADQDAPWDAFPLAPEPPEAPLPPTRIDRPAPTRLDGPPAAAAPQPPTPQPPTPQAAGPPRPPTSAAVPPPAAPAPAGPPPAATPPAAPRGRWGRKPKQPAQPVNRLPVQPRPITRPQPPSAAPATQGRPLPPPPPWVQRPPQRPLPPPRRRRRRGRRFGLFLLLGLLCCCGGPVAYFTFPAARQYPVTAVLPQSFLDLDRRDDDASKRATDRLAQEASKAGGKSSGTFAAVYGDGAGKRVTIFGVTGWRLDPGKDVRAELDRLSDEFGLGDVQSFPGGEFGVYEQCAVGRSNGNAVVVCAWADHGSMATVLLTRRSLRESAGLVEQLRSAVLSPGITGRTGGIPAL